MILHAATLEPSSQDERPTNRKAESKTHQLTPEGKIGSMAHLMTGTKENFDDGPRTGKTESVTTQPAQHPAEKTGARLTERSAPKRLAQRYATRRRENREQGSPVHARREEMLGAQLTKHGNHRSHDTSQMNGTHHVTTGETKVESNKRTCKSNRVQNLEQEKHKMEEKDKKQTADAIRSQGTRTRTVGR